MMLVRVWRRAPNQSQRALSGSLWTDAEAGGDPHEAHSRIWGPLPQLTLRTNSASVASGFSQRSVSIQGPNLKLETRNGILFCVGQ